MAQKSFKIEVKKQWPLVLGLDISGHSIKYLLLRRLAKGFRVEAFGKYAIDESAEDSYEAIQQVISWLFQRNKGLKNAKIILGLSGSKVIIKTESFPSLSKKELLQTIFFEIQKEIGTEGEEGSFVYDYQILGPDLEQEGNFQYLTMGVPEEIVDARVRFLVAENVIPTKVTPSVLSITNLVRHIPEVVKKELVGLLDIGAARSTLIFLRKGNMEFFREIVVGGEDFTRAITGTIFHEGRAIQFKNEEALEFKLKYGYPEGFSEGMTFLGAPLSEVGMMMRPVVERLTGEIQRSIGFYKEKSGGQDVEILYLIGGGAKLKHLPEVIKEKLGIQASLLPLPEDLRVGGDEGQREVFEKKYSEQAVSLSLALETSTQGNLLPEVYKTINKTAFIQKSLRVAAALVIVVMLFLTFQFRGKLKYLRDEVSRIETRDSRSKDSGPIFAALTAQKNALDARVGTLRQVMEQDETLIQLMRLFSHAVPENLSLTLLEYGTEEDDKKNPRVSRQAQQPTDVEEVPQKIVRVRGESIEPGNDVRIYLAQLIVELEKSGYFSDVKFESDIFSPEENIYAFEIVGYLQGADNETTE